ncbi:MAG: UDP-glucuronate 4-epimerase [Bacteroidia bacterium]
MDTTKMHDLIGETSVEWREGIRGQLQNLAPEVLKAKR